ncbi:MAG: hypothetical protein U0802_13175 [Candidatus Binatia bacterium]
MSFDFDDDDEWRAPELTSEDVPEDAFLLNAPADPEPAPAPRPRRPRPQPAVPEQESPRFDEAADDAEEALDAGVEVDEPEDGDDGGEGEAADEGEAEFSLDERPAPDPEPGVGRRRHRRARGIRIPDRRGVRLRRTDLVVARRSGLGEQLTRRLPLIGSSLRDVSAGDDIALVDVHGRYERTKDGKVVFVVTGAR